MKVGVMPRADTRKLRSTGEPDALKGACPVREGAVGNLRQPVVPVVRRHKSQQGAGRLLHRKSLPSPKRQRRDRPGAGASGLGPSFPPG